MKKTAFALAAWMLVPALPAAAAGDDDLLGTPPEGASATVLAWSDTSGYVPRDPRFGLALAFGDEAMGGVGQCGNPSDRALRRCKLRLADGGPAVINSGTPATAVGVRFSWRF